LLLGIAAISAIATSAAYAQEGIEVVTVTAAKRAENVQDVAISMEVVGQQKLEAFNISGLQGLESKIPGLDYSMNNGGSVVALRGFGSNSNPAYDQTVAVYKDGIFQGKARQNQMPFFDVQRIEVLRGPQGALIGKNSAAGAISIISNLPTDTFEGSVTSSYLIDEKGVDVFGYVSGPVTDDLSARVAVKYRTSEGLLKNFATGKNEQDNDTKAGRLTLHFQPEQGIDVVTKLEYASSKTIGHNFFGVLATPTSNYRNDFANMMAAGGYTAAPLSGLGPDGTDPHVAHIGVAGLPGLGDYDKLNSYDLANTATFDLGGLTLVSVTGYSAYSSRYVAGGRNADVETVTTDFIESFKQTSQEFRLLSPTDQTFEWIIGFYADFSTHNVRNVYHQAVPGTRDAVMRTEYKQDAVTYSGYATGTWHVTDDLRGIVGVRGTAIPKSARFQFFGDSLLFGSYPNPLIGPFNGSHTDSTFDPSVTVEYDVAPGAMIYAGYSKGSKAGTFQATSRAITMADWRLKQEVSTSYEIGAKTQLWDWLLVDIAAYYMEMKNAQVQQFVQLAGEAFPSNRAANAAKVRSQGVELIVKANLDAWVEGLSYELSGAYTDAIYDDYPGAPCNYTNLPPRGNCISTAGTLGAGGPLYNAAGLPLLYNSVWKGTTSLNYKHPIFDGLKIDAYVGLDMRSKYYFDQGGYDPNIGLQAGIAALDVRLALSDIDDKWSIAFIGTNINDTWRGTHRFTFPGAPGTVNVYGITGGRKLAIQGSLKF
jgi:iron complex outermembrane receptor protein